MAHGFQASTHLPSPALDPPPKTGALLVVTGDGAEGSLYPLLAAAAPACLVLSAHTLATALDRWRTLAPTWVVIDLAWPDALTLLANLGAAGRQRAVVLVEPGQERLALEAIKQGAADYVFKDDLAAGAVWTGLGQPPPAPAAARDQVCQHYQNLIENSPDIIERFDRQLRHLYVSPALSKLTGLERDAFLGKTCRELGMDETMVDDWEAAAAAVLATGEKQTIEFATLTLTGRRHFEMAIVPEWSAQGQIESILTISRDISDRVAAQQTQTRLLAEAQTAEANAATAHHLLTSVFDRINDGIVALDADWRLTYINPRAAQIVDRSAAELIGQQVWEVFPEAIEQPFYQAFHQAVAQQQPLHIEQYYAPYDRWFENRIYPSADGVTVYFTDITDRKTAAASRQQTETLRQELRLLEQILDSVLAGYWDFDFEHQTAYYSPGFKAMFGYTDAALPNHIDLWQQLAFADDIPRALASLERHVQSRGEVLHYVEMRYRHRDGSTVWVICAGQVIAWDDAGQPRRMVGCHVDITQLKQAEEQLYRHQAHLQAAQRIGNLGSWEFEVATERITWSDQVYRIFGLTAGEQPASFDALQRYFHPDDQARHRQTVEASMATQQPYDKEFRIVRADGRMGHIQVRGESIVDGEGQLTHLTGTVLDISDRKRNEAERNRAEAQRQSLSLRLSLALKSGQIGSWERDLSTDEVVWDQCLVDLYGFASLGRPANYQDWRRRVYADDIDRVETAHRALMAHDAPYNLEFRIWRGDGSLGWIRSSALVQRDSDGQPLSVVGINYDITEKKQAEQRLLRTTAQLVASNQELEAFAYSVSHDLRAPLRAIDGFSRALVEDYGDQFGEEGRDYFERIRHNVGRMGRLIDDLLRLSRVSRSAMVYGPVDLSALVQEQIDELRAADPDRAVVVTIAPGVTVSADPVLMRVAVANLVQNAWKFTAQRPTAHLDFGVMARAEEEVYYLRDDGVGFDMAYVGKLFGVFQRLHNTDEFPGTGIGLATVQRAIHRHGGQVWAEAAVGRGATFYFTLAPATALAEDQL
ncbi:MAG TPA: PAS domain-containing protein [Nodosilinea sp.]|nr:PAS domain-containing protein [Nodosilinea sp.]